MTEASLAAVLWDMDGTLIDSEPYWMSAEVDLVARYGGEWSREDALQLVGNGMEHSALILQSRGVRLSSDEIIDHLVGEVLAQVEREIPWRPGARELLHEVRDAGIRTALVTMSPASLARHVAGATGFDAFDTVVSGEDTSNPKPHPDPYLEAMRRLEVDAAGCVAIEDSEPGLAAAVASGACAIAVPVHVPLHPSPAYTMWRDGLEGRSVADLAAVLTSRRAA